METNQLNRAHHVNHNDDIMETNWLNRAHHVTLMRVMSMYLLSELALQVEQSQRLELNAGFHL